MKNIHRLNIAIVVESINSYGRGIIAGIGQYVHQYGNWTIQYMERSLESQPPEWLRSWRGDGIIVRDRTGVSCDIALTTGAKVVDLSEIRHPGVPTVYSDHAMSAQMAADHFIERGFRHFAFVGIHGRPFSDKRKDAFVKAVPDQCYVYNLKNDAETLSPWIDDHDRLLLWLAKLPKPVAILACYDLVGLHLLQCCRRANLAVPDSVSVMGINNDELQCNLASPTLSSVMLDSPRVGYEACLLLDSLIAGNNVPEKPLVVPTLGIASRRSTDTKLVADEIMNRAVQFIREYACDGIDVSDVAEHVGLGRRTLERRFERYFNCSPNREITRVRMKKACELLSVSNMLIETIAHRVGFGSSSHFTVLFQREFGLFPKEYRKQFGSEP